MLPADKLGINYFTFEKSEQIDSALEFFVCYADAYIFLQKHVS